MASKGTVKCGSLTRTAARSQTRTSTYDSQLHHPVTFKHIVDLLKDPHFTLARHGVSSSSVARASRSRRVVRIPSGTRIFSDVPFDTNGSHLPLSRVSCAPRPLRAQLAGKTRKNNQSEISNNYALKLMLKKSSKFYEEQKTVWAH